MRAYDPRRLPCSTCGQQRHYPELGICATYDAEVAALRASADAQRELMTDCLHCGAQLIRWAHSPTVYEFDRQTVHLCGVRQQEPMATSAEDVGQRPFSRTTARLAPAGAAPRRGLSVRKID